MKRPARTAAVILAALVFIATFTTAPAFARGSGGKHKHTGHTYTTIPHEHRHVTAEQKRQLFEAAGIPKSERKNYVIDHKIPLELGGTNDGSNLQVQSRGEAKRKDKVENYLAEKVRHGEMSLPEAQEAIQHWQGIDTPR